MNRRILAIAFTGTMLAAGLATANPASAATTCTIVAGHVTTGNIGVLVNGTNVAFGFSGTCAEGGTISANGTLANARCGLSDGAGSLSTGQTFSVRTVGTALILTGQVTGGGEVVADPTVANNSCKDGNAHDFLLDGSAAY